MPPGSRSLLAHGLIRASFVPDAATQELRTLLRTRKQLVRERSRHVQRIHKALEDANIKLEAELSDVLGKSGRAMLDAMVAGGTDPVRLAALAHPGVKSSQARLQEALHGRLTRHHRFLLQLHLGQIDGLDAAVTTLDREVDVNLAPFRTAVELVSTIPGVSKLSAEVIVSEIGLDMSRFPTVGHLLSWAGLCPRNDQSAGKRRSTRLRKGAPWLKTALVQCAWAAKNKKASYLQAQFRRLLGRRRVCVCVRGRRGTALEKKKRRGVVVARACVCAHSLSPPARPGLAGRAPPPRAILFAVAVIHSPRR